jgi:hypothetical protein
LKLVIKVKRIVEEAGENFSSAPASFVSARKFEWA